MTKQEFTEYRFELPGAYQFLTDGLQAALGQEPDYQGRLHVLSGERNGSLRLGEVLVLTEKAHQRGLGYNPELVERRLKFCADNPSLLVALQAAAEQYGGQRTTYSP